MEDNGWGIQYMDTEPYCYRWVTVTEGDTTHHFRQLCHL